MGGGLAIISVNFCQPRPKGSGWIPRAGTGKGKCEDVTSRVERIELCIDPRDQTYPCRNSQLLIVLIPLRRAWSLNPSFFSLPTPSHSLAAHHSTILPLFYFVFFPITSPLSLFLSFSRYVSIRILSVLFTFSLSSYHVPLFQSQPSTDSSLFFQIPSPQHYLAFNLLLPIRWINIFLHPLSA
jgi:hypothetical protein